jgi:hypothetical protein
MASGPRRRRRDSDQKAWSDLVSWLFSGDPAAEEVVTSIGCDETPETVWRRMMTYEEVSLRPPVLLRALLPQPLRTEGDKTCVEAEVLCLYNSGFLIKRITKVEPPHLLQFDVVQQRLGIEGCITAVAGSYAIRSANGRTAIALTTKYTGHLRPRYCWQSIERLIAHQFHNHILNGMWASLPRLTVLASPATQGDLAGNGGAPPEPICTTPLLPSQH